MTPCLPKKSPLQPGAAPAFRSCFTCELKSLTCESSGFFPPFLEQLQLKAHVRIGTRSPPPRRVSQHPSPSSKKTRCSLGTCAKLQGSTDGAPGFHKWIEGLQKCQKTHPAYHHVSFSFESDFWFWKSMCADVSSLSLAQNVISIFEAVQAAAAQLHWEAVNPSTKSKWRDKMPPVLMGNR